MLKIRLTPPSTRGKNYFVFIDCDFKRTFKSKREATEYITKIESELNEVLLFINEFFSITSNFYRTYFIADRDFKFKYGVDNCFENINERLNYISNRTASENYNTFILQALNMSMESLVLACELICKKSRSRYDMLTRRRILLYKRIIIQYRDSFELFKNQSLYSVKLKSKTA
jgi:hypothetical protein